MQFELRRFLREGAPGDDNWMTDWVRRGAVLCAALLVVGTVGGVPVATASGGSVESDDDGNEAPLADAGLDQEVPVNATVYLDASGSRDADGSIATYEWSIEQPDGTPTSPRCDTCARSEFQAGMPGTYVVTVTVTDDDGAARSDTLKVRVHTVEGPEVTLSGPTTITENTSTTFTATADAGESPLAQLDWKLDESDLDSESTDGRTAVDDLTRQFEPGTHNLSVRVVSELGRTDTVTLGLTVTVDTSGRPPQPCPRAGWNDSRGEWDAVTCSGSDSSQGARDEIFDELDTSPDDSDGTACVQYNQNDDTYGPNNASYYCDNDAYFGGSTPSIRDVDQDGNIDLGNQTFDEGDLRELADQSEGVSVDTSGGGVALQFKSKEAYREVLGTSYADPEKDASWSASEMSVVGSEYQVSNGGDTTTGNSAVKNIEEVTIRDLYGPGPVVKRPTTYEEGGDDSTGETSGDSGGNTGDSGDGSDENSSEGVDGRERVPERYTDS